MWFKFPVGVDQISIEQQNFQVEHEDDQGRYFQVPDHFAPTVLNLPGFVRVQRPKGAPEDLVVTDPKKAEATDKLALQVTALSEENERLRQELGAARRERDGLQTKLDERESPPTVAGGLPIADASGGGQPTLEISAGPAAVTRSRR